MEAHMRRSFRWIGLGILGLAVTGCVSQDQYKALKLDRDQLAERLAEADNLAGRSKAEADLLKKQLDALQGGGQTTAGLLSNLTTQNAELTQRLQELNPKYANALQNGTGTGTALPEPVTNAPTACC